MLMPFHFLRCEYCWRKQTGGQNVNRICAALLQDSRAQKWVQGREVLAIEESRPEGNVHAHATLRRQLRLAIRTSPVLEKKPPATQNGKRAQCSRGLSFRLHFRPVVPIRMHPWCNIHPSNCTRSLIWIWKHKRTRPGMMS